MNMIQSVCAVLKAFCFWCDVVVTGEGTLLTLQTTFLIRRPGAQTEVQPSHQ